MVSRFLTIIYFSLSICFLRNNLDAQTISTNQLISFPLLSAEQINDSLEKFGWEKTNVELITDSNFIRHNWELKPKMSGAKSYFLLYEFTKDTTENYIIYQFSERADFVRFKKEFQNKGYKQVNNGKSKKKNHIHKEHETLFYSKKTHSLVVVKETFNYGLFSFLIYSYKPNSSISKLLMPANSKPSK